jgi:amino acid adenylation domain-containing protein
MSYSGNQPLGLIASSLLFPFAHKVEAGPGAARESLKISIDQQVSAKISSTFTDVESALLAVWETLLWRFTNRSEVMVCWIGLARTQDQTGTDRALLTEAVPVSVHFSSDLKIADVVRQVHDAVADPVDVHSQLQTRSQDQCSIGFLSEELAGSSAVRSSYAKQFEVSLCIESDSKTLSVELLYHTTCFTGKTAERIGRAYSTMLSGAVADPNCHTDALPMLSTEDYEQVVNEFNRSALPFPDICVHELFEKQVKRTPERIALRFQDQTFTYEELNARANQLAHRLRKYGVGPNVPVPIFVERSAEMIIGMLAIMKAGGAYVPLLHDDPQHRIAHLLAELQAPALLTTRLLRPGLPDYSGEIMLFDEPLDAEPKNNPEIKAKPSDLVCVIYTSGSTGVPKGVAARHSNLANYAQFICHRLELSNHPEGWHFATVSTIGAILGNTSVFASLMSGGCLHVISYEMGITPQGFADYVAKYSIDVIKITPSQLSTLLAGAEGRPILPQKYVVVGGEKFTWELVEQIRKNGNCKIMNHFGPTETMGCCTFVLDGHDFCGSNPATVPLGRPMSNQQLYIVDRHLRPVPIGVPGELCMSGAGLTDGYFSQPQQTAEKFVANPFSTEPGARLYRTGDLARYLPDGNIEFLGRIDHQVKIRGFRVEPAEIEAAIKSFSKVKDAVVVPEENQSGEKILAAYVVPASALNNTELRSLLRQELPDYMIPSRIVRLDALPLNRNGKVDLPTLATLPESEDNSDSEFVPPGTPAEELLARIWTEVLQKERIGVHDNFFELGGHSLLALQIISHIRNEFHVQFPLFSFLEAPTIADMAAKIADCPAAETEKEEMERLLLELESISEEEARHLVAEEEEDSKGAAGAMGE